MSAKIRKIKLLKNGVDPKGVQPQTIIMPESSEDFYNTIKSLSPGINNIRLFLEDATELNSIDFIRNNDTIYYASNGEEFVEPKPKLPMDNNEWVTLNIDDNNLFCPSSRDKNGAYLIDRSPKYFEPILNYLRCGQLLYDKHINPEGILAEARFFGIESIVPMLESILNDTRESRDQAPLSRRDVVDTLIRSSTSETLRFQGVNLAGADLSKLDLRSINFKYANMQRCNLTGANLSWCCLERADLSHAILDNAQLLGVRGLRAIMEGASMKNCNFKDPAGIRTNLEGVNLKGACLEDSDMGSVNLRIANCKNANLKNCDLRAAVLAGADLENCDLSGSDLHEANLRGANLKDAAFELMLTPLHMSQTIR